ncbi:MAG TPA: hypothetical protein VFT72_18175 [Opitutaceae bacterium]|nr:hypothetical protein [Opitutaceae bacterium]
MSTPPRLLSFLAAIEAVFQLHGAPCADQKPERFVNFQKGIARMTFRDGSGALTLQNFTLADGQICVKAEFNWANAITPGSDAVYPTGSNFDWQRAAEKIAEAWLEGPAANNVVQTRASEPLPAAS